MVNLLLLLAACPHSAPVEPAAPAPSASSMVLPRMWWTRPALLDAPLAQLVRVNVRGMPWARAAQRLGFSGAGFSEDHWGEFTVMAHQEGPEQDFAVYLDEGADTTYGVIVRGKSAGVGGALPTITEAARRASHGAVWGLYAYQDYLVLASEVRPLTEIGCSGPEDALICYAAVYGPEIDPRAFTSVRGNEEAVFQRRVTVQ